jgi:hypothetical protein
MVVNRGRGREPWYAKKKPPSHLDIVVFTNVFFIIVNSQSKQCP